MTVSAFTKFYCLTEDVAEKKHNFDTDTVKLILSNTAPDISTDTVLADITQISGNGYTTDGYDTQNSTSRTSGVTSIIGVDITLEASGGNMGPFRYAILYNSTAAGGPLLGYWDYGVSYTLSEGGTFAVDFGTSMFTIT